MAHRGGAGNPDLTGLENTLAAFEHAAALGYRYLETDVHASADGEVFAFHDDRLDRVTDHTGAIAELSAAEVSEARVAGRHAVPRMADLLEALPQCRFNIDVKAAAAVDPLAELVTRMGVQDRVLVGSFSWARLTRFRRRTAGRVATSASPVAVAAALLPSPTPLRLLGRRVAALQVPVRSGPVRVVTPGFVRRAHAAGTQVHAWTVDEPTEMRALLDFGVDGLITDRTDVLRQVLIQRGQWDDSRH